MNIIELVLDEDNNEIGIEAISVVENPAIEEDFIALKSQEFKLAEVDKEKRILMGAYLYQISLYTDVTEKMSIIYISQKILS